MDPHRSARLGPRDRVRDAAAKPVIGQRSREKNQSWIGPAKVGWCRKASQERAATRIPECGSSPGTARNGMLTTLYMGPRGNSRPIFGQTPTPPPWPVRGAAALAEPLCLRRSARDTAGRPRSTRAWPQRNPRRPTVEFRL